MISEQLSQHAQSSQLLLDQPEVFQRIYECNHISVFRFIYGLQGGPVEDVEDLTITTFLRAWKSRQRFKGDQDAALGWLLKIARNLVIDAYRRNKNRGISVVIEDQALRAPELSPEEQLAQVERIKTLWCVVKKLPRPQREIIVLRYILEWQVKDIAIHLNKSENNISATIHRTLDKIHKEWPKA